MKIGWNKYGDEEEDDIDMWQYDDIGKDDDGLAPPLPSPTHLRCPPRLNPPPPIFAFPYFFSRVRFPVYNKAK